jgi:hypothetical protein
MALDILFFHNRNRSLADETNWFTITFNKEVFPSPIFFENQPSSQIFQFFDAMF